VDKDNSGTITQSEWLAFWVAVKNSGHTEDEITEELEELMAGKSWVYFDSVQGTQKKK
jgi:hypothetical protein